MKLARSAVVASLGFFALAAQTVLFRDFVAAFEGNELGVGSFFGAWLVWVAVGATVGRFVAPWSASDKCPLELLTLLYVPAFLLQHLLIANARELGGVSVYEVYPFAKMLVVAFWINAPVSLVTGGLFTLACRWSHREHSLPVARIYILETLGGFTGGVAVTSLLVAGASTETVFVTASVVLLVAATGSLVLRPRGKRFLAHLTLAVVPLVILAGLIGGGFVNRWADANRRAAWQKLLPSQAYRGSFATSQARYLYGQREGQFLVVTGGGVVETLPATEHAGEVTAITLAQRPETQRVLVIGPGSYGICTQFHALPQIQQVVWLHPDTNYPQRLKTVVPKRWRQLPDAIEIPTVEIRPYLGHNRYHFDLIVLNLPDATTLAMNRFWTREFYALVKNALGEDGVVCTRVSGAANYMAGELVYLGAAALETIESCFQNVVLKPGDESWIFASDGTTLSEDPEVLRDRFAALQEAESIYPPDGLLSLYLPDRAEFQLAKYRETMAATPDGILLNTDRRPQALLFSTLLALRRGRILRVSDQLPTLWAGGLWLAVCPVLVYGVLRCVYLLGPSLPVSRREDNRRSFDGFLILSTGLTGMSLSILLMFLYQSRFGALYLHIGLISSLFMLGSCLGSLLVERFLRLDELRCTPRAGVERSVRNHLCEAPGGPVPGKWFLTLFSRGRDVTRLTKTGIVALLSLHLALVALAAFTPEQLPRWCYGLLFMACGWFVGVYFPIVAFHHRRESRSSERSGAILETLDHLGGAAGAVLAGWFLIPLLGTTQTLMVLGLLVSVNLGPWLIRAPAGVDGGVTDRFDGWLRPCGYSLFGFGAAALICSNLCAYFTPSDDEHLLVSAAREMAADQELQQRRASLSDGSAVRYLTTAPGAYFFGSRALCDDVYGYGGPLGLALHVDQDGTLRDLRVVRSNETPIYLENLRKGWLSGLTGRNLFEPAPFDGVDAVSGSTMTSQAVLRTLERSGVRFAGEVLGRHVVESPPSKPFSLPDSKFVSLALLLALALALRRRPDVWRRRGFLLISLLLTGVYFNVQYSTQQVFSLLSFQVHGSWLSGSFFLAICVPLMVILFGNVYCGYVCPFGALQELIGDLRPASWGQGPDKRVWRYGRTVKYLLLFLVAMLFATTRDFGTLSPDPLISLFGTVREPPVALMIGVVLALSFVFRRFWCRNLCPAGAFLSLLGGLALLGKLSPAARPTKCDLGVRSAAELDCLCCDRCRHAKN